jgi:hypothetical protein
MLQYNPQKCGITLTRKEEQGRRNKWLLADWEAKKNALTSNLEGSQMDTKTSITQCMT